MSIHTKLSSTVIVKIGKEQYTAICQEQRTEFREGERWRKLSQPSETCPGTSLLAALTCTLEDSNSLNICQSTVCQRDCFHLTNARGTEKANVNSSEDFLGGLTVIMGLSTYHYPN